METQETTLRAEREMDHLEEKYYLEKRTVEPNIYITPTDDWITFIIRYITEVRKRRIVKDRLSRLLLQEIQASHEMKIATATLDNELSEYR